MKNLSAETWSLALCIAILPPIWAVLAPYLSVDVGAVALICAGLYVTNGNKLMDAPKITIGFLLGNLWGWLAVNAMQNSSWNADVTTFMTLFAGRSGGHHSGYGFRDDTLSVMALRLGNHPYGAVTP